MKFNFLDKCSKIATLSTCVLNNNHDKNTSETEIQLTDNFGVKTRYSYTVYEEPDVIGPVDVHVFDMKFFRDGQLLDFASFKTVAEAYTSRSLCDKDNDLQFRLEWLQSVKPDIFERVRFMTNRMNLTNEEMNALMQKADELETIVNGMVESKGNVR